MVLFDASFLSLLLNPNVKAPFFPKTTTPVDFANERIEFLVRELERQREKIIVPTPVLSEVLILGYDNAQDYLAELTGHRVFVVEAFDSRAAVEAAIAIAQAKKQGGKRGKSDETWAKVKYDRQIVAIAKTRTATTIYSNDGQVRTLGELEGIKGVAVWDLPKPPAEQMDLLGPGKAKKT